MPDFGPHVGFILGALGTFAVVIGGLIIQTLVSAAATRRALRRFERDGKS